MPLFRYKALSAQGKTLKGVIDADSLLAAKERLRREQLLVTEVEVQKEGQKERTLPQAFLLAFTQELAHLLRAGLPLYDSLQTIEEKYRRHKAHPVLLDLADHLKEGHALSAALKRYPKIFDSIYLSMVGVAEHAGNLVEVFAQLAQLIERQHKLKKQIVSAIAYPAFLFCFCLSVSLGLFLFVIPTMKELFDGKILHPMTTCVIAISNWLCVHFSTLALTLLVAIGALVFFWKRGSGKYHLYLFCTKVPLVKTLLLHSALVRLCRALAMLLGAGVPLLEALHLTTIIVKNPLLEASLLEAEKRIMRGERFSQALKESSHVPSLVIRLVAISEETGKMQEAFGHLCAIYGEEVEKHLSHLTTFLQPLLLIILGMIVGLVVLSILLPLTDVSSFI